MKNIIVYLLLIVLPVSSLWSTTWRDRINDEELLSSIENNLEDIGERKAEIELALENAEAKIFLGLAFLVANSPAVNLISYDADSLLKEVRLAYKTREIYPWGKEISDNLFYNYVLPNQVSQEPLTYYREFFLDKLAETLDTVETGSQAAIAVNYWCGQRVRFQQTQRQDQGVFHTLSSGYGRCEEMMIVYISALRAAGIPAREAWTPYWATGDNNHAWTELWADGEWHYAGSCEPKPTLDNAWFNKTAKRAAVILSSCFGIPKTDEIIYRERDHYAIINSTPHYIEEPALLRVEVPAESTNVYLSVFNFGALRPIMRLNSGDTKEVIFTMGRGDYIISGGDENCFDWAEVHTEYGEETRVSLNPIEDKSFGANQFWLRYPPK